MLIEDYRKDSIWSYYIDNPYVIIPIERKKTFSLQGIGVYVFLNKDHRPLYVGFSKDLNERINMHFRPSGLMKYMLEAKYIMIYFNRDMSFEKELIKKYNPEFNNSGKLKTCNQKTTENEYKDYNSKK
jgi:predicted GIY-YIG superfamily endonuclease